MASLHFGASRADITPPLGCRFSGHLNRNRPAEAVLDPLFARVLSLTDGRRRILIVNLDLLELGPPQAARLEAAVRERVGFGAEFLVLTATHTHTGPPVIELAGMPADDAYFASMASRVSEAARAAIDAERPAAVRAAATDVHLGVNRRRSVNGRVLMSPNPQGSFDPQLAVVSFDGPDGRPRGLLLSYGMHPTTLAVDLFKVSADYPGRLGRILRERLGPDLEYAFLQGGAGDVKPAICDASGEFRQGDESDIEGLGRELADAALRALGSARPAAGTDIEAASESFLFRYGRLPDSGELEEEALMHEQRAAAVEAGPAGSPGVHIDPVAAARCMAAWARRMREQQERGLLRGAVESRLAFFRIGAEVAFVGVPGELFAETVLAIKRASPFSVTLVGGYTGGSLGYLPTAQALREGGYEASEAYKYYGHPAAFAPETTDELVGRCGAALQRLKRSAASAQR